ncbi:DUF4097 family beta strand repeat-containing protein [Lactobacillus sp. ESL0791]|uniref:DUF4097 family beta strand repeat-containing protein n=1 Tax=Lactobacillus sp. ESL0791 TaxID=2983234 RepID=UPI0023FA0174|nr:DUF4097 family beta strand repeat-containing protein [Lactobacillus sp. ESL0791]MDF7637916.1 DUF4097 family beta strand repeat-containing protein [Lactobacillus sp. ESL0791]
MKKSVKIATTIIIIGLILIAAGLISHDVQHNYPWHRADDYPQSETHDNYKRSKSRIVNLAKFNQIKLDLSTADVHIHPGNRYQVRITENHNMSTSAKVHQGVLEVSEDELNHRLQNNEGLVDITIPSKNALSKITGKSSTGDFELENLHLQSLTFNSDTGDCELTNTKIKQKSTLNIDGGDLDISGSQLNGLTCQSDCGDVEISHSQMLGKFAFYLDTGDFELDQASRDSSYQLTTRDGEIDFFDTEKRNKFIHKVKGSKNSFVVDSSFGDISIE